MLLRRMQATIPVFDVKLNVNLKLSSKLQLKELYGLPNISAL